MKRGLLEHLICPDCSSNLKMQITKERGIDIVEGALSCSRCAHHFPITKSIPRFVDADQYATSFSVQRLYVRRHFEEYRSDRSGDRLFFPMTGFGEESIRNGLSLEVGCGYGRFLDVVDRIGGEIVGIDLSTHSIELAQDFVGNRENVHLVQCDLFRAPFRRKYFSNVFSIGVLHHTPNARAAFQAVVPLLAVEGRIAIWVYHPDRKRSDNRWRVVTTKLPHQLLYAGCIMNQATLSWLRRLPGGWRINTIIPGAIPQQKGDFWRRVLSDFDSLSPTFTSTHTHEEVVEWFREAGLKSVLALDHATAVTGTR